MAVFTTIDDSEAYFQVASYTGTGSSNAITLEDIVSKSYTSPTTSSTLILFLTSSIWALNSSLVK